MKANQSHFLPDPEDKRKHEKEKKRFAPAHKG